MAHETLPRYKVFDIKTSTNADIKKLATNDDNLILSIKNEEKVIFNKEYTEFKNPIILTDPDLSYGYVYKEDKNLLWQYNEEAPINITGKITECANLQYEINDLNSKYSSVQLDINKLHNSLNSNINQLKEKIDFDIKKLENKKNNETNEINKQEQQKREHEQLIECIDDNIKKHVEELKKNQEVYQNIFHLDMNSQMSEINKKVNVDLLDVKNTLNSSLDTISDLALLVEFNTGKINEVKDNCETKFNEVKDNYETKFNEVKDNCETKIKDNYETKIKDNYETKFNEVLATCDMKIKESCETKFNEVLATCELAMPFKNVNVGDIVGVNSDGYVEKISGYFLDLICQNSASQDSASQDSASQDIICYTHNNKNIYIFYSSKLIIYDMIGKPMKTITAEFKNIINENSKVLFVKNDLVISTKKDNKISIYKISDNQPENSAQNLDILLNPDTYYDLVYNENLNIFVLCVFISCESLIKNKIKISLYDENFNLGYTNENVVSEIILDTNDNMQLLIIPGNNILVSFHNIKFFILLPCVFTDMFSVSSVYVNSDSVRCCNIIYNDGNILSVEKTIANTYFLNLMNIKGLDIISVSNKKLDNLNITPLSILKDNNEFVLFYIKKDNLYCQSISCQDKIKLKVCYKIIKLTQHNKVKIFEFMNSFIIMNLCKPMNAMHNLQIEHFNNHYGIYPKSFIGMVKQIKNDLAYVVLKNNVFESNILIPEKYVGKNLYLTFSKEAYPNNITTENESNIKLGICLSKHKILIT